MHAGRPVRPPRRFARAIVFAGLVAAGACVGGASGPIPVPALASSPEAAAAFDDIRLAWSRTERADPASLRRMLERFVARFPNDGLKRLARVYLAIVALQQGDLGEADRQLDASADLPPGTARDLWTVARARRARLGGADPEASLELLRPLVGQSVDPLTRAVFEEELTLSALATHRDYEAISYMDAWLRASSEEDRSRTNVAVSALVERIPTPVLVGTLRAMRAQRATFGYGVDIERILADRLASVATENGDAELARMLLDPSAGALVITGDAGVALSELATSRRGLNAVMGRTIGLLLPTDSPGLRDESADVLRGVMWALGLPRGLRNVVASPGATDGGGGPARAGCSPFEPVAELDEPRPRDELRLVTRDDAGRSDRTEVSLDELAGEGASIVIAGLDPQSAIRALRWGERRGVAVIALEPPEDRAEGNGFGFVLGETRGEVVEALARAAPAIAAERVVPIIDARDVAVYPPGGGRLGSLTMLPPISCDIPVTRAGDPRFPLSEWERDQSHAWLVSGSPRCAGDVIAELTAARSQGIVALTLEAAALPAHSAGLRVWTASAGVIPSEAYAGGGGDEMRRFAAAIGNVNWWTALGRDAGTLGRSAVDQLPADTVTDAKAVSERRRQARDRLTSARARLWTTESAGWTKERTMNRTVCAIEVPADKPR